MASVNRVILVGNVGNPPATRNLNDGGSVASFSLATTETWKDKSGEKQEKTEWHRCSAFGRLADVVSEYVNKGTQVYVEGKLQTRKWQDKDGQDKYTTEIIVERLQLLGGRPSQDRDDQQQSSQAGKGTKQSHSSGGTSKGHGGDFGGEDIPFATADFFADPTLKRMRLSHDF